MLSVYCKSLSKNPGRWLPIGLCNHFSRYKYIKPEDWCITLLVFPIITSFSDRLSIGQPGHLPEVIADTDQLPYQPHLPQSTVQKSPESEYFLDLPEDMLNQA